ncbi:MAG: phosphoglycerate dehydrogenase [Pyrinomonadaceae bacterium]|nr:phosphoglycerate dehydrogenase [Pyrinomonadaceae bacterium]
MGVASTSYPRDKIKILLLENISNAAVSELEAGGYTQIERMGGVEQAELVRAVRGVHLCRYSVEDEDHAGRDPEKADGQEYSRSRMFLHRCSQVDLASATEKGIAVFNAPYSNTRSVAELVIGLCVMLIRKIADKNAAAHNGIWLKESKGSFELRGKTLGIIGYGNIGSQVSTMAEAMGMHVIYFDAVTKLPLGNARQTRELRELLRRSDIVTLHVPSDRTTRNMIDADALRSMRKGSILINYSRGDVVDLNAVAKALKSGKLAGAAVDVFPDEPERTGDAFTSVLQNLPNVILTPHIGGSTEEAQANIGLDVTGKLIKYVEYGTSDGSHTVPPVSLPAQAGTHRILHIHRNVPGVLGEINSRLSGRGINIAGQYLKTNDEIGYVILDVESKLSKEAFELLKDVPATVKARMVY